VKKIAQDAAKLFFVKTNPDLFREKSSPKTIPKGKKPNWRN
jgi:hypothetical protein